MISAAELDERRSTPAEYRLAQLEGRKWRGEWWSSNKQAQSSLQFAESQIIHLFNIIKVIGEKKAKTPKLCTNKEVRLLLLFFLSWDQLLGNR